MGLRFFFAQYYFQILKIPISSVRYFVDEFCSCFNLYFEDSSARFCRFVDDERRRDAPRDYSTRCMTNSTKKKPGDGNRALTELPREEGGSPRK